ncbi:MAG: helix-turn-helix domain-containing protein [Pseudomonadota bacterium]
MSKHIVVDTTCPRIVHSVVARYLTDHDIQLRGNDGNLHAVLKRAQLGGITLNIMQYGCDVSVSPKPLEDFYLLHINLSGECDIVNERFRVSTHARLAVICSPDQRYVFHWHGDSRVLAIQLPRARMLAHARRLLGQHIGNAVELHPTIDLASARGQALLGLVQYLVLDCELDEGLSCQPTSSLLEDALIDALLRMQAKNEVLLAAKRESHRSVLPAYVRAAERYMADNMHRPLPLAELAEHTGVSSRTLSSSFNRFLGESPARYFLKMRLARARSVLLDLRVERSIGDIAFDLGFSSHSAFAAAYKGLYCETPSETLQTQRLKGCL